MGVGKPEEVVYRYALSKLRVKAEEAWMVGDNLEWDVLAPQRLGLRGVWVDGPGPGAAQGRRWRRTASSGPSRAPGRRPGAVET